MQEVGYYKIYVGDYRNGGLPNTWTITGIVPRAELKRHIKELIKVVKQGMEIYVVTPKKETHAIFREGIAKKL